MTSTTVTHYPLTDTLPCAHCALSTHSLEAIRPEGRQTDVWRVVCTCGNASARWSVCEAAAVRLWNRYMAKP